MERYWCLRWLLQEQQRQADAGVLREGLVRLERLPLVLRVPSMPALPRGARVRVEFDRIDLFEAEARARFVEVLAAHANQSAGPELDPELDPLSTSDEAFGGIPPAE